MSAPHLPPKSCSIKARQQVRLIPWVLFALLISSLCSVAIALSAITWFFPQGTGDISIVGNRLVQTSDAAIDPFLERAVEEKMLTIFNAKEKIDNQFYSKSAVRESAVLLSSDGWAVLSADATLPKNTNSWEVIDGQGRTHTVLQKIKDASTGLVYIKIDTEGSRISSVYPWSGQTIDDVLWYQVDGKWQQLFTDHVVAKESDAPFAMSAPQYEYALVPAPVPDSVVIDNSGRFVGFTTEEGTLTPSWLVESHLPSLLSNGKVQHRGLPYKGQFVDYVVDGTNVEPISGFYVASSPTKISSTTIGVGDIIVRVNNMPVNEFDLAREVQLSGDTALLTLFRDNIEVDILVQTIVVGGE